MKKLKSLKKRLALFMAVVFVISGTAGQAAFGDSILKTPETEVDYIDEDGKECTASQVTWLSSDSYTWNEGWYSLSEDLAIDKRVTVLGDVKLILSDDTTLTIEKGISVYRTDDTVNSLTIYSQSGDDNEGVLYAGTDGSLVENGDFKCTCVKYCAAIGGYDSSNTVSGGRIVINGGKIYAVGGISGESGSDSVGIGGANEGSGGDIIFNGGSVWAYGNANAAIGSGDSCESENSYTSVTINGGSVSAEGLQAAAIGQSLDCKNLKTVITINGGNVFAGSSFGAAIGNAPYDKCTNNTTNITINGGNVYTLGAFSSAIGGTSFDDDLTLADSDDMTITINGGSVSACCVLCGAGIGAYYCDDSKGITINGGDVSAFSLYGAGIGGAIDSGGGRITINGGNVQAGSVSGAAIGSGCYTEWFQKIKGDKANVKTKISVNGGSVKASLRDKDFFRRFVGVDYVGFDTEDEFQEEFAGENKAIGDGIGFTGASVELKWDKFDDYIDSESYSGDVKI